MNDTTIYGNDYNSKGELTSAGDISLVEDLDNATQTIRNRLMTKKGTYPSIDDEYGSLVHEIIGEKTTSHSLEELKIHIQNCMLDEPKVEEVIDITIEQGEIGKVKAMISLILVDGTEITTYEELE